MKLSLRSMITDRSILLQVAAVLMVCQLVAHAVTFAFVVWRYERPDLLTGTSIAAVQAIGFRDVFQKSDAAERSMLEAAIERANPHIRFHDAATLILSRASILPHAIVDGMTRARPELASVTSLVAKPVGREGDFAGTDELVAIQAGAGRALVFDPDQGGPRINVPRVVAPVFLIAFILPMLLLPVWAAMLLTDPLRRLAQSAERFSIDLDPTPLPEVGPAEIGRLAAAFNLMRTRIRQLVDSRSRMLAAVSHDLRTPLTRLRLKTEALPDGEEKEKMLRDISAMNAMIGQALSYLRDQTTSKALERVDLPALLGSICDDFSDAGLPARFTGPRNVVLECEPELLTRAVSNLVDNAVKFGGSAVVRLEMRAQTEAAILVEDNGPGIPDPRKLLAFEPFSRGDPARGMAEEEGFGLGLAIAKQIIERHGGQITLHDRAPENGKTGGLLVQVLLPVLPRRPAKRIAEGGPLAATACTPSPGAPL
ncbi:MAG: ATP-binding protein [Beijerinckiaceae bacterium]|nr:ATP-binding protein [Beijerinckiaceae bacterium]MCZ8301803.1 ATP-binding protein [Beijerinckiaceae bacterium]